MLNLLQVIFGAFGVYLILGPVGLIIAGVLAVVLLIGIGISRSAKADKKE